MSVVYARAPNPFVKQVTPGDFSLWQVPERISGTGIGSSGRRDRVKRMSQPFQISSLGGSHGERLWLSALVETMEQVGEGVRQPCDSKTLKTLRAQLALPAQPGFASSFSSRN